MSLNRYTLLLMTLASMWMTFTHATTLDQSGCSHKDTQIITTTISKYLVKNTAVTSHKFDVTFKHCVNNYALFKIHPEKAETDDAYVYLHNKKHWQVLSMGTYFDEAFLQKLPKELRKLP